MSTGLQLDIKFFRELTRGLVLQQRSLCHDGVVSLPFKLICAIYISKQPLLEQHFAQYCSYPLLL